MSALHLLGRFGISGLLMVTLFTNYMLSQVEALPLQPLPLESQGLLAQEGTPQPTLTAPLQATVTPGGATIHVVQRDETLFRIAQQYGTTVETIVAANGLRNASQLQIGQRLLIPNIGSTNIMNNAPAFDPSTANSANGQPGSPLQHIIQPSDSLYTLAWRYSMDVNTLARLNKILNPRQTLFVGNKLLIKEGANGQKSIKSGNIYIARKDDTIYRVALRFGLTLDTLLSANQLGKIPLLFEGQRLVIPNPTLNRVVELPTPFSDMRMTPEVADQGRSITLHFATQYPVNVRGRFINRDLLIFSDKTRQQHVFTFGIHAFTEAGLYPLDLWLTDEKGNEYLFTRTVMVNDGNYPQETIQLKADQLDLINPNITKPEYDQIMKVVSQYTNQQFIKGQMGLPCAAAVTSQYGTRRSYNGGEFDQFHTGTDFAALPDSPIYAPSGGVVVMATALNVRGNATIIDHGQGIFSGYWHQNEIKVKVGDIVSAGQVIGTVGSTGRATGPHLHWELFVNGVQVDPLQWTRQSLN